MKKKVAVFVIALLSCLSLAGCGTQDGYDKVISEIRNVQYRGSAAGVSITAQSGEREADYRVDGVSHDRKPFFILSVLGVGQGAKYSFDLGDKTYQGTLNKHPFTDEYVASFDFKISEPITVKIDYGGNKTEIELSDAAAGAIDYNKALAIAKKELEPQIKKNSKNGTFDGEVYLRLIPNPVEDDGTYYWYAAFCKSEDECFSLLLDAKTGSLVAKKTE
jgi:predicted small secreted protein